MSLPYNKTNQQHIIEAYTGPNWCFLAVPVDEAGYFEDPLNPGSPLVSGAISVDREDEDIKVEFQNKEVSIIPAGMLKIGLRYPLNIVKVFDTGTGPNVKVLCWMGDAIRGLRPITY